MDAHKLLLPQMEGSGVAKEFQAVAAKRFPVASYFKDARESGR